MASAVEFVMKTRVLRRPSLYLNHILESYVKDVGGTGLTGVVGILITAGLNQQCPKLR
jgi:hypothetical protein